MSYQPIVTFAPYALEAARLLVEYLELLRNDNPDQEDVEALALRWQASNRRATEALERLRRAVG